MKELINIRAGLKDYILEHFKYKDGLITRDDRANSNGSIDRYGYLILKIKGVQFKAHRVAWLLNYGEFPIYELDHINGDKTDNRIENLRESNRVEQNRNRHNEMVNKDTHVVGIYKDRTNGLKKKYAFNMMGKTYRFNTVEDALKAKERMRNAYKTDEHTKRIKGSERAV